MFFSEQKCVSYTRKASWRASAGTLEVAVQDAAIQNFLEQAGAFLSEKYSDGEAPLEVESEFERMVADGMERKFDVLVVYSLYHCGSSFLSAKQMLLDTLYMAGVRLIVVSENMDSGGRTRGEVLDYFEAKRREMHADIFKAWKRSRGEGFVLTNSVPYGYVRPNGADHMSKDKSVAPYLAEMFHRHQAGESPEEIAEWLNQMGADTPLVHRKKLQQESMGGIQEGGTADSRLKSPTPQERWNPAKVLAILRNPVYTGARSNKKREILATGCHEAYLTTEEFLALPANDPDGQTVRRRRKRKAKEPSALPYRVFCARCGTQLLRKPGEAGETARFTCRKGCWKIGEKKSDVAFLTEEQIADAVLRALQTERRQAQAVIEKFRQDLGQEARGKRRALLSEQMKRILAEMEMEQFQRVPLYEQWEKGEIPQEEYERRLQEYEAASRKLDQRLEAVMDQAKRLDVAYGLKNPWLVLFDHTVIPQPLDQAGAEKLIRRVEVEKEPDVCVSQPVKSGPCQLSVRVRVMEEEWKELLPADWFEEGLYHDER